MPSFKSKRDSIDLKLPLLPAINYLLDKDKQFDEDNILRTIRRDMTVNIACEGTK